MPDPTPAAIEDAIRSVRDGRPRASEELLPLVYEHLRRLARARMAKVPPGNTLQPTALVHEAYLRLSSSKDPAWDGRGHFFAAAAEAMRQILVDQARRKASLKRGGDRERIELDDVDLRIQPPSDDILDLDTALDALADEDRVKADVVLLRHFAGLDREETARTLGLSPRTVDRHWTYARTWLARAMRDAPNEPGRP
ncbi:MAG TPA: sigma-70 family RNA polymerase sigma factor [Candidatus Krumholzibacteria bacterium]|nr:sigma-70 family RNA polymerase sigma factor [Candidatus Krumholzibacteria bacterium]